jgi:anthranilate phosphoribosyltransferase
MKKILSDLYEHKKLSREEAKEVLINITKGQYNPTQIASFMTVFLMRSISTEELEGFKEAILEMCNKLSFDYDTIDLCGTGGDGKNTFNISTLSSLVVAGAGYKVAKHGNYGLSSISGSSNVLESLGYKFTNDPDTLKKQLDKHNICFMHAPLFHPALKGVGPLRKELGIKTFFNMLGPLVNPSSPKYQMVGVFSFQLARLYSYILSKSHKAFSIIHTDDGYDEISLTSNVKIINKSNSKILSPNDFQLPYLKAEEIYGGSSIEENLNIFKNVINGKGTEAQNAVIIANSSVAIQTISQNERLNDCIEEAKNSLFTGKASSILSKLI